MDLAHRFLSNSEEALKATPAQDWDDQRKRDFRLRLQGRASAFAEAAEIVMEGAPTALLDDNLRQVLSDALLSNRAFIAGRAFGVPEDANAAFLKEVVEGLMPVVKSLLAGSDGGLEYAKIYGNYPDGRRLNALDA
jgi:hypothetical protein